MKLRRCVGFAIPKRFWSDCIYLGALLLIVSRYIKAYVTTHILQIVLYLLVAQVYMGQVLMMFRGLSYETGNAPKIGEQLSICYKNCSVVHCKRVAFCASIYIDVSKKFIYLKPEVNWLLFSRVVDGVALTVMGISYSLLCPFTLIIFYISK